MPILIALEDSKKPQLEKFDERRIDSYCKDAVEALLKHREFWASPEGPGGELFRQRIQGLDPPVFAVGCAISPEQAKDTEYIAAVVEEPWDFVFIRPAPNDDARLVLSRSLLNETQAGVENIRRFACKNTKIIAHGGVHQPIDAEVLRDAGADVVLLDSGLVESGPGLPKRINELLSQKAATEETLADEVPLSQQSWLWTVLLGIALLLGGTIAIVVGLTRVLLPYDEEFLGMLREEICGINPQLLPFMQHDRITLSGTMLSLGTLYSVCGWFGERKGRSWVRIAALTSAAIGFFSFFLFLGYGYFDPFHAFITAVLFQFVLLGFRSQLVPDRDPVTDRVNCPAWKRALWGQLLYVAQGVAIITAGCVCLLYTSPSPRD